MTEKISIIVPCYNEKSHIIGFIKDLKAQDYSPSLLEFIIIDGNSNDGTTDLIKNHTQDDSRFILLKNEHKTAPFALNMGIKRSSGEYIVRMDVHASYPKSYVKTLVEKLKSNNQIANVGSILETKPSGNNLKCIGIAYAMSSPLGVGSAKFRTGITKDTFVDTVPFGCFRKELFNEIGKFNEELARSQDYDLNTRIGMAGYKILLTPDVKVSYYARNTYRKLSLTYFQYAYSKVLCNIKIGRVGNFRQFAPLTFFSTVILLSLLSTINIVFGILALITISTYLSSILIVTSIFLIKKSEYKVIPSMFVAIISMHASYAYGYVLGLIDFFVLEKQKLPQNLKISR
jgi:glycosyltransferase involved in cell wall biosynthesis